MKNICKYLSYAVLALGTIGSIVMAKTYGVVLKPAKLTSITERSWPLTIGIFIGCMFSVSVLFVILRALYEILEKLESLEYNTEKQSQPDSALSAAAKEVEEKQILSKGGWKCPDCGKINYSYFSRCQKCNKTKV